MMPGGFMCGRGRSSMDSLVAGRAKRADDRFDYATHSVYKIRVRVTDQGGLWIEKAMVIGVTHG